MCVCVCVCGYVEKRAYSDTCDLNTDRLPANTSVEKDCATGVHVTRNDEHGSLANKHKC